MDESKWKQFAREALTILCSSCAVQQKALDSESEALMLACHMATVECAANLVDKWYKLDGDEQSIRDLADSLGVSVDG